VDRGKEGIVTDLDERHDVKGLAIGLKRSRGYIEDMKSAGFVMIAGRASLREAVQWLANHPNFSRAEAARIRYARRQTEPNGEVTQMRSP
jgi:hypothetical protein